ncbi:MAG: HNH endonuclease [Dehalococcoidia bacterium]|nr:HNH endonuclease [Dehalococcoidia bacterium]
MLKRAPWSLALAAVFAVLAVSVVALALTSPHGDSFSAPAAAPPPATADGVVRPNPRLTPGDVLPVAVADVCAAGYSRAVRDVSASTKDQVYARYGVRRRAPGDYEVDHLVPLAIGGSNDLRNLWPQPAEPRPGYREKDRLEGALHDLVCNGELDLARAQEEVAADWYAAYRRYVVDR